MAGAVDDIVIDPDTSTGTVRLTLYEVDTDVTGTLVINDRRRRWR